MRFKLVNSDLPNYNNTLLADEQFYNDKIFTYCQLWRTTDTVTVQIKSSSDTTPTAVATKADKSTVNLTVNAVSSYDQDADGTDDLFFFAKDGGGFQQCAVWHMCRFTTLFGVEKKI